MTVGVHLAIIRNPFSCQNEKYDAAIWLIEHGFDRPKISGVPIPVTEILAAYYGGRK